MLWSLQQEGEKVLYQSLIDYASVSMQELQLHSLI